MVITIAQPMKSSAGAIIGASAIDINIEDIAKLAEAYKLGNNGYIVLLDAQGIVLTHPNKEMLSKPLPESLKVLTEAMNKNKQGIVEYDFTR